MLDDTLVDLGRRVRPHAVRPGRSRQSQGPRPLRQGLQLVAGRRRRQARHRLRRDRRLRLEHHRRPGPRPRHAGHDPAPLRHRPHAADVPLPGPPVPPDRRAWGSGQGDSRLAAADDRVKPWLHATATTAFISQCEASWFSRRCFAWCRGQPLRRPLVPLPEPIDRTADRTGRATWSRACGGHCAQVAADRQRGELYAGRSHDRAGGSRRRSDRVYDRVFSRRLRDQRQDDSLG